jgi:hypothetical protein
MTAATEARLLNWFAERAESVDDRQAISLIAKVLDGDGQAMIAAYNAWIGDGGSTAEFYHALVETRKALEPQRTEMSEVVKSLKAVPGLEVEELEGHGMNGFLAYVPKSMHGETLTGPDGLGFAKLLAGTMWPDDALEGLTA